MDIDGNKIFKSVQANYGAHYDLDDWTLVDWLPLVDQSDDVFAWLKENKICYIVVTQLHGKREAGFCFWIKEDAVAFKLRWL